MKSRAKDSTMRRNSLSDSPENQPDPARDPYYLWHGLAPGIALPFDKVRDGLALFIKNSIRPGWDIQTERKLDWYLSRDEGLSKWAQHAANQRLKAYYRPAYTAQQFHELHFTEAMRAGGKKEFQDPFWTPLVAQKQLEGDTKFLRHIDILVNQPPLEFHAAMRLFCIYWDRYEIPFSFWTYPAIADFLRHSFRNIGPDQAPSSNTVKQWANRLALSPTHPPVVTEFNALTSPNLDFAAFDFHRIPPPNPL
jgi:hypothetical protein